MGRAYGLRDRIRRVHGSWFANPSNSEFARSRLCLSTSCCRGRAGAKPSMLRSTLNEFICIYLATFHTTYAYDIVYLFSASLTSDVLSLLQTLHRRLLRCVVELPVTLEP